MRCFGKHCGSLEPLEIMLKCTTMLYICRVLTLSVQSLFQDLLLERVRQAFFKIWVPIGAPFDCNGGIVVGYRFHVFLKVSGNMPNPTFCISGL